MSTPATRAPATAPVHSSDDARSAVQRAVARLAPRKREWLESPPANKLAILRELRDRAVTALPQWMATQARIRNLPVADSGGHADVASDGRPAGQARRQDPASWQLGPALFGSAVNALIHTYTTWHATGRAAEPSMTRARPDGQAIARAYPVTKLDAAFAPGFRGEVWFEPGHGPQSTFDLPDRAPGLTAVLGAGNYEAPLDALGKLFVDQHVVVYKANPANAANAEIVRQVFAPLIERGVFDVVLGGADVGQELLAQPEVDAALMTGTQATYERIVHGAPDGETRTAPFVKPLEAELGGVSPVIVMPGRWSKRELDHHAGQVAAAKVYNAGHTCASPQVIVTDAQWPQRGAFLERVRHHLLRSADVAHYIPGATERRQNWLREPRADWLGRAAGGADHEARGVVWLPDLAPDSPLVRDEVFGLALAEVPMRGTGARLSAFWERALAFCRDELPGTLAATLIVDPRTRRAMGSRRMDDLVADLPYGCIGVNLWAGALLFFAGLPWGAHTGPATSAAGSGKINNMYGFAAPQKSVLWTPFRSLLHPQQRRRRDDVALPRLARYVLRPTPWRLTQLGSAYALGV